MNVSDIAKPYTYALLIYILSLLFGFNFLFFNLTFGHLPPDFWLLFFVILLPALVHIAYFFLRRNKAMSEDTFHRTFYVAVALAVIVVAFFIIPISYW